MSPCDNCNSFGEKALCTGGCLMSDRVNSLESKINELAGIFVSLKGSQLMYSYPQIKNWAREIVQDFNDDN